MIPVADSRAASWLAGSAALEQLLHFGPPVFEAYARLKYIPDPTHPGQDETDAVVPDDHLGDLAQAQVALKTLANFTNTNECYFCVWPGYSDIVLPVNVTPASMVELPHRHYVMFRGELEDIETFAEDFGLSEHLAPPAFVWPADHSWCFASDVDPHWAGIGAGRAAIEALLRHSELDVVEARPDQPQPLYY